MRMISTCTLGTLVLSASAGGAQQISAPLVREPSAPKESAPAAVLEAMRLAPMPVWREGDPVRVKGDLRETVGVPVPENRPIKRRDALAERSQAGRLLATLSAPMMPPTVGVNVPGISATGVLPPDTIGAVGANHYIQMVNSAFAIYDKSGQLLAGPSQINSLWRGFGGGCETDNDGDPVVRYDHLADRWLVSQFAINRNLQCIAISKGPDPTTSGWFLYAFETHDANGAPVTPDYPKIGVWPDGYYMSTQRGFPSEGMDVWVFERGKMLAGQPARQVQFSVSAPSIVLQPSDLDGPPPPAGTPNFFVRQMDGERFGGQDRIELFALSVSWTNPAASTLALAATLPTAPFDSLLCTASLGGPCVPQPGTATKLHTLSVWPMFRAQYRNMGSHQVLMLNHSVDGTGQDRAAVRWYELRRTGTGPWSIFQQGTHMPDAVHRWMGSAAMDGAGNIAIGYSAADAQTSPGIRAAARRASYTPGTLGPEITVQAGGGSQTHPAARWGDYGAMDVDPTRPCAFWFTTLYYETTSSAGWKTRIAELRAPDQAADCKLVVPNLEGLTLTQARQRLTGIGLAVGALHTLPPQPAPGALSALRVVTQAPPAGSEADESQTVDLTRQRIRMPPP